VKFTARLISSLLSEARTILSATSDEPAVDAQVLLCDTLDCTHAWLIAHGNEMIPDAALEVFSERIARRAGGEPIAYITGKREFWSIPLRITHDVLIPRADTELLVECALRLIPAIDACSICDLGTGSGAIALAIACERPHAQITATDISDTALRLARDNACQTTTTKPTFIHSHWLDALDDHSFDVLLSNPPYIRCDDPHLSRGDLRFEPRTALAAGIDGLDDLRTIIEQAPRCMKTGAWLLLEHGYDQGSAVRKLLHENGFEQIETHRDLAGHERVSQARHSVST
jgi:release factor glutamine methyltransferase